MRHNSVQFVNGTLPSECNRYTFLSARVHHSRVYGLVNQD
jgi:hypothetical protein